MQDLPHLKGASEVQERISLGGAKRQTSLTLVSVELEDFAGDTSSDGDDVSRILEAAPGQLGQGDEADARVDGMFRPVVQIHEDAEPLDGRHRAGQELSLV